MTSSSMTGICTVNDRIELEQDVLFRRVAGEGVVVDQLNAQVMVVNEVGLRILELIREGRPAANIPDVLAKEFNEDRSKISADFEQFLGELREHGLISGDNVPH
jgi:hypothetical protein